MSMEPLKPIFILLSVLAAALLIFLVLRLDKPQAPAQNRGDWYNWKQIY